MLSLLLIIFSFVISLVLTGLLFRYASSRSLIDIPNERSSHAIPTPRGGGLAIVITYLITLVILVLTNELSSPYFWAMFVAGGGVALMGFVDDHGHIAARWRLLTHFVASGLILFWLGGLPALSVFGVDIDLGVAGDLLAVISLVWWLNLYNFMDGIDGLAAVETLTISLSAVMLLWLGGTSGTEAACLLLLLLAASVLGFLFWNKPPAQIFMGDVGSTFLGFMLGLLAIVTIIQGLLSPWVWLILGGAFIVDATVTLLRRMLKGERWFEAHRSHAYQKATIRLILYFESTKSLAAERARAKAHGTVSLLVLGINVLWLLPLAYFAQSLPTWGIGMVLIAWLPLVLLVFYFEVGQTRNAC